MCFLGDKLNGIKLFDIRGQHEVVNVNIKVIWVSISALGPDCRTFMTHRAYINTL